MDATNIERWTAINDTNIERWITTDGDYVEWRSKAGYMCGGYIDHGTTLFHWSGASGVEIAKARLFASTLMAICDAIEQEQRERNPREEREGRG